MNINLLNENEPFISKAESSEKILVEENDDKIVESNLFRGGKQQEQNIKSYKRFPKKDRHLAKVQIDTVV